MESVRGVVTYAGSLWLRVVAAMSMPEKIVLLVSVLITVMLCGVVYFYECGGCACGGAEEDHSGGREHHTTAVLRAAEACFRVCVSK